MNLSARDCIPCQGGVPPLRPEESKELLLQLSAGWELIKNHHLQKMVKMKNFADALQYVNRIGEMAEAQNHHPDLELAWGRVTITIWTHKIDGLTQSDFIFAAKCDALL